MTAAITQIDLYMALRGKIGETEAKLITEYVDQKVDSSFVLSKEHLATKKDLAEVKSELLRWMFVFWIGQLTAMLAFLLLFLGK